MRRLLAISATSMLLAACASGPRPPEPQLPTPSSPQEPRRLLGLTPNDLIGRLGAPSFQVREGTSLKLQFRNFRCVLDAYLYPSNGALRVTHVDTRAPNGADADQATCLSTLERRS